MPAAASHFDPTRAALPFAPGAGPFQARGVVYVAVLKYAQKHVPGGLGAVRVQLDPADARFLDQLFLPGTLYDLGPLIRLVVASAKLVTTPIEEFVVQRSRESAERDIRGIYRLLLLVSSPRTMASRLPQAFDRYFVPARAELTALADGRLTSRLSGLPLCIADWYRLATQGFVGKALEMAGAKDVRFRWKAPEPAGEHSGLPTASLQFEAEWS